MIILTQTTDKIQVKLGGTVTTSQLQCFASYRDTTTSGITPGRNLVSTNNTTAVDLVGSPGSSTQRVVEYLGVYNADTTSDVVTFLFNDNGTTYELGAFTILSGEKVEYQSGSGFCVIDAYGAIKNSLSYQSSQLTEGYSAVILGTDYTNANAVARTLEDVTGFAFSVTSGKTYWFRFSYLLVPAAASNGHMVTINGPTTTELSYYTLVQAATNSAAAYWNSAFNTPNPATTITATSPASGGNGYIEGIATFSANGTLQFRVASETAAVGITIKAGSVVYYKQLN
jgi:hypothetical protein